MLEQVDDELKAFQLALEAVRRRLVPFAFTRHD